MTVSPRPVKLQDIADPLPQPASAGAPLFAPKIDLIQGVKVRLSSSIGQAELSVSELFALKEGALLALDKRTDDPVEITLDGKLVALGELVVVGDQFGVRLTKIGDAA